MCDNISRLVPAAFLCVVVLTLACNRAPDPAKIGPGGGTEQQLAAASQPVGREIIGKWVTTQTDPAKRTIWEFTNDGKVKGSSGPEFSLGTFKFLDSNTMEIAWEGDDMEKVTFKIKLTKDELEYRAVAIDLGDGKLSAEGPITTMKRANP